MSHFNSWSPHSRVHPYIGGMLPSLALLSEEEIAFLIGLTYV